jgi:prephenate dehydrogenase
MNSSASDGFLKPNPDSLRTKQIAVIGLGLMGGSLAMNLRKHCASIQGIDPDLNTRETALRLGLIDTASATISGLSPRTDLIILAAPVCTILSLLQDLPRYHSDSAIVIDLGSTKTQITQAMTALPEQFDPLGGHPMCGKEKSGLVNASVELFVNAVFVLTPLQRTSQHALAIGKALVAAVGARPVILEPEENDRWTAATSHLPYLLASALALATPPESATLVGPGFRSTSRLAASSPGMMLDILKTNSGNLKSALAQFREKLDQIETCLEQNDWDHLEHLLAKSATARRNLVDSYADERL